MAKTTAMHACRSVQEVQKVIRRHAELVMVQCTNHLLEQNPSKDCCIVSKHSHRLPVPEWAAPSLEELLLVLIAARVSHCFAPLLCCCTDSTAVVQSTGTLCSIVACAECNSTALLQPAPKSCSTIASAAPSPSGDIKQKGPVGRLTESDSKKQH
jgi:hypothetical protein